MAISEVCISSANLVVATLKVAYLIHQHNHWTLTGSNFYQSHLLFQRIYESALEDLDTVAESVQGNLGPVCIDYILQTTLVHRISMKLKDKKGFEQSLEIERSLLEVIKEVRECFKREGTLSMGMDNVLAGVSQNRDTAIFLLKQSMV